MFEQLVEQLQSDDPNQRRQAVSALANSKNPAALKPLAYVYRNDPDPDLRELALKAGRFIRQHADQQGEQQAERASPGGAEQFQAEREITARDREMAKGQLDAATGHFTQGDNARAIDGLGRALTLNPELQEDQFVINLITNIMRMPVADALPILMHPDRRADLIARMGGKKKLKVRQQHGPGAENATWENVLTDIGILWFVSAVALIVGLLLGADMMRDFAEEYAAASPSAQTEDFELLWEASIVAIIVMAMVYALMNVMTVLIQGGAIHLAATYILAGSGTLAYLYRRLLNFNTIVWLIGATIFAVLALTGGFFEALIAFSLLGFGGSLIAIYFMTNIVAEVYGFGWFSGCGAIFLGGVLLYFVSVGSNYVILTILTALFT